MAVALQVDLPFPVAYVFVLLAVCCVAVVMAAVWQVHSPVAVANVFVQPVEPYVAAEMKVVLPVDLPVVVLLPKFVVLPVSHLSNPPL